MLSNKSIRIFLIIFAVITVVGLTAGMFGSVRSDNNADDPGTEGTHTHDFEVISSVAGTCTTPGSETVRCKTCLHKETRATATGNHAYSDYEVCKICGHSDVHTLISKKEIEETDYYDLGEFSSYEACTFLVLFNQGSLSEYGYYVFYNGETQFEGRFGSEMKIKISDGRIYFNAASLDYIVGVESLSVYIADPNANYVEISSETGDCEYYRIFVDDVECYFGVETYVYCNPGNITVQYDSSYGDIQKEIYCVNAFDSSEEYYMGVINSNDDVVSFTCPLEYQYSKILLKDVEEQSTPTVTLYFETYSDWLCLENPEDTYSCPAYLLPMNLEDKDSFVVDSEEPLYMRSEYLELETYYIALSTDVFADITLPDSGAVLVEETRSIGTTTYNIYKITADCTINICIYIT